MNLIHSRAVTTRKAGAGTIAGDECGCANGYPLIAFTHCGTAVC